jgi:RNA polymerase sigma-70 factor (ECF subfamily)
MDPDPMGAKPASAIDLDQEQPLSLADRVARLYEESREEIYRYIVMLGIPREEAQEICQEAFLRLYRALSNGQQIDNPRAWVFTVARNQALTRRAVVPLAALDQAMEEKLAGPSPSPEQSVLDLERFRRLRDAISRLNAQQRQCLYLRTRGFRYREIGEIMGLSTSTVGEAMQRAIERLREVLYD